MLAIIETIIINEKIEEFIEYTIVKGNSMVIVVVILRSTSIKQRL